MPLEATLICIDNSEWTRNGDFAPSRFESQTDAANLICGAKTNQHPESSVGLLTMAGERVEVRVTPTQDLGRMLQALHGIKIDGKSDFVRGIQTAHLSLKHRQNKNQRCRIICFVASPVDATEKALETLGRTLKKNNVAIDIVSLGEIEVNADKLQKLVSSANSNENCHYLAVETTGRLLSAALLSSPIVMGEDAGPSGAAGGEGGAASSGGAANEFGIDPNSDPELFMALRMSLEEERNRQNRAAAAAGGPSTPGGSAAAAGAGAAATPAAPARPSAAPANDAGGPSAEDIAAMEGLDDDLRQALLMSLQDSVPAAAAPPPASADVEMRDAAPAPKAGASPKAKAKASPKPAAAAAPPAATGSGATPFQDPAFVQNLLGSLPGVDMNDPQIQEALRAVQQPQGQPQQRQGATPKQGTASSKKGDDKSPKSPKK